ncbi:MAG TPA: PAS domain-containing protein [Rhizomicrobium sp.]|jgi:hypothetical protein
MPNARAHEAAEKFNRFAERMGMPARCDASLSFEAPKLVDVAELWREKVRDNGLPHRSDFHARNLKEVLPHVIIADRVEANGESRYRFRLMGTVISELLGEHTGKFVDEAVISPFRERWSAVLDSASEAGCPLRIFGRLEYRQQDYIAMEIMAAPLGSSAGPTEAILVIAQPTYSMRHVFHPLVKNKITSRNAPAS